MTITNPGRESRFFSSFYDSVHQRHYRKVEQRLGDTLPLYIARLRFDALITRTPVLVDTYLLDGMFFLNVDPITLVESTKREDLAPMPIEVMSRAQRLDEALVLFVRRPRGDQLRGFTFSTIEDVEKRAEVQQRLSQSPAKRVRSWRDIPRLLRDFGVSSDAVEKIETAWAHWIEIQNRGLLMVKRWRGSFELDRQLESYPDLKASLRTQDGRELLDWVYQNRGDRSKIDVRISDLRKSWNKNELADLALIESWYHHGYNRAAAQQHNCLFIESIHDSWLRTTELGGSTHELLYGAGSNLDVALDLPETFLTGLGNMQSADFRELFVRQRDHFNAWWSNRDKDALQRAFEPFVEKAIQVEVRQPPEWSRYLIAGVGAFIGQELGERFAPGTLGSGAGAAMGAVLPLVVEHMVVEHILRRPVRQVLQRIVRIAEERHDQQNLT